MNTSHVRHLSAGAVMLLALTACTGGEATEPAATAAQQVTTAAPGEAAPETTTETPTAEAPSAETSSDEETPADDGRGPLEKLLGGPYAVVGGSEDLLLEARVQQLVAECMAAEGWEYIPVRTIPLDSSPTSLDGLAWGTVAFAEAHGYAITTDEDLTLTRDVPGIAEGRSEDLNFEYEESLSESAWTAYNEALHGIGATGERDYVIGTGCTAQAEAAVAGDAVDPFTDEKFAGLFEEMQFARELAFDDARVVEVAARWSECLADAGFSDLPSSEAAQDLVQDELETLRAPGEVSDDALAKLRERERSLAVADFTCRVEHDYHAVEHEVRFEQEQEFIDSHRAELDALVAAITEYQAAALS